MSRTAVCPWWSGYILNQSLRKIIHDPQKILANYLTSGMTALDVGCGMGFFTLPMAHLVGENGYVVAVDIQQKMLDGMQKHASQANLISSISPRLCTSDSLNIDLWSGKLDFALCFMMLHEVPNQRQTIKELHAALTAKGKLLFVEPVGHVKKSAFYKSIDLMKEAGFHVVSIPSIPFSHSILLGK